MEGRATWDILDKEYAELWGGECGTAIPGLSRSAWASKLSLVQTSCSLALYSTRGSI